MRKLTKKELQSLEIKITESGFTIWCRSKTKKGVVVKHWLLDASCLKEDGEIRIGRKAGKMYTTQVVGNLEKIELRKAFKKDLK